MKSSQSGFSTLLIIILILFSLAGISLLGYLFLPDLLANQGNQNQPTNNPNYTNNLNSSSASDALKDSTGRGIVCNRIQENSETPPGRAYIKDGKIKYEGGNKGLMTEPDSLGISKDNTLWQWTSMDKTGYKFELSPEDTDLNTEAVARGLDEHKQDCQYSDFEDSVFDPPKDIEFKNL